MKRDHTYLLDIANAAELAVSYIESMTREQFLSDVQCQDSVIRRLEIIGEASRRISETFRDSYPELPWKEMIGMRNFLIHDYDDVDIHLVWKTAKKDLPVLLSKIKNITG